MVAAALGLGGPGERGLVALRDPGAVRYVEGTRLKGLSMGEPNLVWQDFDKGKARLLSINKAVRRRKRLGIPLGLRGFVKVYANLLQTLFARADPRTDYRNGFAPAFLALGYLQVRLRDIQGLVRCQHRIL